jgi:small ligand-binding sensory domain FIST
VNSGSIGSTSSHRFGAGFAAVGTLSAPDHAAATRVAIEAAVGQLSRPPDLLAVFASGDSVDDLDLVGPLAQEISGAAHVIGCSAAGVCGAGQAVLGEPGVSAWAAVLPDVAMRVFHLEVMRTADGLTVVGLPQPREDETAALLFADPFSFPVVSFVERSAEALPGMVLAGGLAGGAGASAGAGSTRLYLDGRSVDRGAVGMLFAGAPGQVVVSQGCRPVGPEMVITRVDGNVVLELAGAPALRKLREVLAGLTPQERLSFGGGPQLGLAMDEYQDEHEIGDYLIRAVIGIDEGREAVAVGDVVEVGRTVRFQLRDADAARADLRLRLGAAQEAKGALLISCNGRGPGMFGAADSDVSLVSECLGGIPVAGLFAGGEIGPVGGQNWLHSFTASVLAFR